MDGRQRVRGWGAAFALLGIGAAPGALAREQAPRHIVLVLVDDIGAAHELRIGIVVVHRAPTHVGARRVRVGHALTAWLHSSPPKKRVS